MSKTAALLFAVTSVLWMIGIAISLSHNGWLAAGFGVLACANVAAGFIWRAKRRKRQSQLPPER